MIEWFGEAAENEQLLQKKKIRDQKT